MADFDQETIEIRYADDNWGPYTFSFPVNSSASAEDGILPFGTTISTVKVIAYLGNVKTTSDLSSFSTITTDIIDPDFAPQVSGDSDVLVKFRYPPVAPSYKGQKATLIFELTLDSGAKRPFYFQYVKIT